MPFVQSKKWNSEWVNGQLWPRQSFISFWEGKCVSCDSSIRNTQICFLQPTSTNKRRVLPKLWDFTFRYFRLLDDFLVEFVHHLIWCQAIVCHQIFQDWLGKAFFKVLIFMYVYIHRYLTKKYKITYFFVLTSVIQIGMQQWNYSYVHNKRFHLFGILSLYAAIDFLKDK